MTGAAFFDLDRTLLLGASGPTISDELRREGLIPERHVPGEGLLFDVFNLVGETLPGMLLTRQAARAAAGWPRSAVQRAGEAIVDQLLDAVAPFARLLIAEHQEAGRPVVMATTTPYDVVKPFADALGLDDVVATRYGETDDGVYDGTIDGEFVWGRGKLNAVRSWGRAHGIEVRDSWAYSDSFYDLPLLSTVGHATAVNPDVRLAIVAAARRWPVLHLDVPPGVPKLAGVEPQQVLLPLVRSELIPYARFDVEGVENIPEQGPAIICGNHRSYFDPMAVALTIAKRGRPVRFLGKKEVFDAPLVGQVARAMGGIRVDRATGSDEPLKAAAQALDAGEMVALMPQGTIPRGKAFFDPKLTGRWGAARLAAMTGAPVIPVGLWGTEKVWPRSSRLPNVLNLTDPPVIRIRVGGPVDLGRQDPDADTAAIMAAIVKLLPPEARKRRKPSDEELLLTFPPGYSGDPNAEDTRRPGTD